MIECGDGIHKPKECEWGEWLLVKFDYAGGRGAAGKGAPHGGVGFARGGGFGRGRGVSGEPNPHENVDMDLADVAAPLGSAIVPVARKRVIDQDGGIDNSVAPSATPPPGFVMDKVNLLENISTEQVDKSLLSTPQRIHDQKRLKSSLADATNDPSVSSSLEGRQER